MSSKGRRVTTDKTLYLPSMVALTSEACLLIPVLRPVSSLPSLRWQNCKVAW